MNTPDQCTRMEANLGQARLTLLRSLFEEALSVVTTSYDTHTIPVYMPR